jgi:hypothetical protein
MPIKKAPRGLIAANAALLAVLAAVTLSPSSFAQRSGRARGDYTMVSGKVTGGNAHVVYILDSSNQDMIAAKWNDGAKAVDVIGYRDLQADSQAQPGR